MPEIRRFLQQKPEERATFAETVAWLERLLRGERVARATSAG
jgi:flagellar biosynthesis/type III secretory pathway ATPase